MSTRYKKKKNQINVDFGPMESGPTSEMRALLSRLWRQLKVGKSLKLVCLIVTKTIQLNILW